MSNIFSGLEDYLAKKEADLPPDQRPLQRAEPHRESKGFLGELGNSFAYSLIEDPIRAVTQTVDQFANTKMTQGVTSAFASVGIEKPGAPTGASDWVAQNLGGAGGMILLFQGAKSLVGNRAGALFDKYALEPGVKPTMLQLSQREGLVSGVSGLFYGGLMRSSNDANVGTSQFFWDRGKQAAGDGAVFYTLGATTPYISKGVTSTFTSIERSTTLPVAQFGGQNALSNRLLTGLISAVPAGTVAAESHALQDGRWLPTGGEWLNATGSMAFVGTAFAGAQWAGSQRPGTLSTNARYLTDKIGLTTEAPADAPAQFRIVNGKSEFDAFMNDLAAGKETADAQITVRPRLNTLTGSILGSRFNAFGDARAINLVHRGLGGQLTAAEVAGADLVATCLPMEATAAAKDVLPGRHAPDATVGDGTAFITRGTQKPYDFTVSTEPLKVADQTSQAPESFALGKRVTGPFGKTLDSRVDVMGQELASGSIRMNFDMYGDRLNSSIGAATISTIGLTTNGYPYFEVGVGLKSWTLNGEPLVPGRNYLDIKGSDVLNYNNVLNLRLTPGAKSGKLSTFDFRSENLLPIENRSFRDAPEARISVDGKPLEANAEIPIGEPIIKLGGRAEEGLVAGLTSKVLPEIGEPTMGGQYGTVARRADGRLVFRARGGNSFLNGQPIADGMEIPFASTDRVVLPDGKVLRVDNYGPPPPEPPPREPRAPREPREPREGEPREPREGEPREGEPREGEVVEPREGEPPVSDTPVTLENGDVINPRTGEVLKEGTGAETEVKTAVEVDGTGVPTIKIENDNTGKETVVEPPVEVVERPVAVEPVERVEQPPVDAASTTPNPVPQKIMGLGEAKVNPGKEMVTDSWSTGMEAMLAKAERVQLPDGSWYPRFKNASDARDAARYFGKILQSKHSDQTIRFGHGEQDGGFVPMVDVTTVTVTKVGKGMAPTRTTTNQFGALTFKPGEGDVSVQVTPPAGQPSDMLHVKKPAGTP